jgi:branched-subunit amino acid aminotransferase/4-amino-4-deoxychorismate lyase
MIAELNGRPAGIDELASLGLYNYGHFTSLLVNDVKVRGLDLHLKRLVHDCRVLFDYKLRRREIRRLLRQAALGIDGPLVVRLTVFAPELELGNPSDKLTPRLLITTRPAPEPEVAPLTVAVAQHERAMPEVKHVGLFSTIVLRRSAQLRGYDDVVFADADGRISEGATWNIGFVEDDGTVVVPDRPCLPGVTMRLIMAELDRQGAAWRTEPITVAAARRMPAAFATNAAIGVRPLERIGDCQFDVGNSRLDDLRKLYQNIAPDTI